MMVIIDEIYVLSLIVMIDSIRYYDHLLQSV
jgi:hypothetical protein